MGSSEPGLDAQVLGWCPDTNGHVACIGVDSDRCRQSDLAFEQDCIVAIWIAVIGKMIVDEPDPDFGSDGLGVFDDEEFA